MVNNLEERGQEKWNLKKYLSKITHVSALWM